MQTKCQTKETKIQRKRIENKKNEEEVEVEGGDRKKFNIISSKKWANINNMKLLQTR